MKDLCGEVRDAIRFLRTFGRQYLEERQRTMLDGQPVPEDVLTYLLRTTSRLQLLILIAMSLRYPFDAW